MPFVSAVTISKVLKILEENVSSSLNESIFLNIVSSSDAVAIDLLTLTDITNDAENPNGGAGEGIFGGGGEGFGELGKGG